MHNTLLLAVSLILLLPSTNSVYEQEPAFVFMGLNLTQNHEPQNMVLSNDEQKVAIYFINATTHQPQYKIVWFDGSQRCRKRVSGERQQLVGWPKGQNLMFFNQSSTQVTMLATDCDNPFSLANFSSQIKGVKFSINSQEHSFGAFLTSDNQIHEYNLGTKSFQAIYSPEINTEKIMSYEYSQNHRYMFIQVSDKGTYTDSRVRVYETESGKKVRDMQSQLMMIKVIERGDYCLAIDQNSLYKVDMTGNQQKIQVQFTDNDLPLGFCTTDDLLISLQITDQEYQNSLISNLSQNYLEKQTKNESIKVTLMVYSSDDGRLRQSIPINYHPLQMRNTIMVCNDQHLAFMDREGHLIVYKYKYDFPVLIVVASVTLAIMLFAIVMALLYMRKVNKKRREQSRQMEENHQSLITVDH